MWSPKTVQRKVTAVRSFSKWAGMPAMMDYSSPTAPRAQPHPLPEGIEGVVAMINATGDPRAVALIALCGLAGLRVNEARTLRSCDISILDKTIKVRGKGDKTRIVPLSNACLFYIMPAWCEAEVSGTTLVEMGDRNARRVVTGAGEKAGLERRVSSHDLRSTFATAAYNKSKDIRAVQELLGHADINTTEGYIGVTMDKMREAGELV